MNVSERYAQEIRSRWGDYFVEWPPGDALAIGDYGPISGGVFRREGNITKDFGVAFDTTPPAPDTVSYYSYVSKKAVEVNARAAVQAAGARRAKAGIEIKFNRSQAIFFNAAGCTIESMSSPSQLRSSIVSLLTEGRWEYKWQVVTKLIHSSAFVLLVASSKGDKVSLDATGQVQEINLANANLRLAINPASSSLASQTVTYGDATPLLGCHRLKNTFLDGLSWTPSRLMEDKGKGILSRQTIGEALKSGKIKEELDWVESRES